MSVEIFETAEQVATRAAEWLAHAISERTRPGTCRLALSGGTTPKTTLERLRLLKADWSRVEIFFVDERCVPPEHPDSNYRMVKDALLEPLRFPAERVHRMRGEDPPDAAAASYERELVHPIDLALMGIGEDGHTASLFPGSALLESKALVAPVFDSPKPPPKRITLTPKAFKDAACLVLATGSGKARAVSRALGAGARPTDVPSSLLAHGTWMLDRAAAAELP